VCVLAGWLGLPVNNYSIWPMPVVVAIVTAAAVVVPPSSLSSATTSTLSLLLSSSLTSITNDYWDDIVCPRSIRGTQTGMGRSD